MYRVPYALSLPPRVTQGTLLPAVKVQQHVCDVYAQGSPLETQSASSHHRLPSTYQNSRPPEGKEMFCLNHIVCTSSLIS